MTAVPEDRPAVHRRRHGRALQARLRLAGAAAALLLAYGLLAPVLPQLPIRFALVVTLLVNCLLLALLLLGLSPLRGLGLRALIVAALALAAAVAFSLAGWVVAASLCKIVAAAAVGFWLVGSITSPGLVVIIAVLAAVVDIVSVATGPTRLLLDNSPSVVGALTTAMLWPGYGADVAYTALGVSDIIFMTLFIGAAAKFRLREAATAAAMVLGVAMTVVAGMATSGLPALPLIGLGFVAVNADLVFGRGRRRAPPGRPLTGA